MAIYHSSLMPLLVLLSQKPGASEAVNYNSSSSSLRGYLLVHKGDLAAVLDFDPRSTAGASTDFGRLTAPPPPAAILRPRSPADIASLIRTSLSLHTITTAAGRLPSPFTIAPRGHGHSVWGQAAAPGGVVIDMKALGNNGVSTIRVVLSTTTGNRSGEGGYVDAGGEQLWSDVLRESLRYGVAPKVWTDYLDLTVGGTLSNAGVSGQAFRHGPQISNILELDVITGEGKLVTCSEQSDPDLFHAVLGGLGQFGIITRARVAVEPAPKRVRWLQLFYIDFGAFTSDQERLIQQAGDATSWEARGSGFDYVEGFVHPSWKKASASIRTKDSFFSPDDLDRIGRLYASAPHGVLYSIEACFYYSSNSDVDLEVSSLLKGLNYVDGFVFSGDVTYTAFLSRVSNHEERLRAQGLWDVPHPWITLFVPKSAIPDFDAKIFRSSVSEKINGAVIVYPLNRSKWDDRMSAIVPDEPIFYVVNMLKSAVNNDTEEQLTQNTEILRTCDEAGIAYKHYLPHYTDRTDWVRHFGSKWEMFAERKRKYDPLAILAPGQGIFTPFGASLVN